MTRPEVLKRLGKSGLLEGSQILWLTPEEALLDGFLTLGNHRLHLRVRLPEKFPLCLPEVQVDDLPSKRALPHLLTGNRICFPEDANLLDTDDPYAVAWETLLYAQRQLAELLTGNPAQELAQEAVAYWNRLARDKWADCVISGGERPDPIKAFFMPGRPEPCAFADSADAYASSLPERNADGLQPADAVYLPIGPEVFEESFHPGELATLEGLRKHFRALSEEDRLRLSLLPWERREKRDGFLVLGLRRPQGGRAFLGLHLWDIRGGHPLEVEQATAKVTPIGLVRRDHRYLAPRGGAGVDLRARRVLVAGCGAVGGYLALSLARAGVGTLTLVDGDLFTPENTYRHACGMAYAWLPKVDGLRKEIEQRIPYVSVRPRLMTLEDLLKREPSVLQAHDMVISALGHPTIERELNKRIWADAKHPPALYAWLEPLGLGGHALLTHVTGAEGPRPGCLDCLYWRPIEGGAIQNRLAFAMSGAVYTRDMLGCGSRYLPYSDLDAQRTADLACRLALRAFQMEIAEATLLSWRGDARTFEREGFQVTRRHAEAPGASELHETGFRREDCKVCGAA